MRNPARVTMATCLVQRDGAPRILCYVMQPAIDGQRLRDLQAACDIVKQLACGDDGDDDGSVLVDGEPPKDAVRLFDIYIDVSDTRRGSSVYQADYRKFDGCPTKVATLCMEIFADVKHWIRINRKAGK